jgi:hypothetical protein
MPINKHLDDLPRRSEQSGMPPARNNFVAEAVAQAWAESHESDAATRELAHAIPEAGPYRGSFASMRCNRQLWYALRDEPKSRELGLADYWRFGMGHIVHEMLQRIAADLFDDAEAEVLVDLRPIGVPGSSHADFVMTYKGKKLVVEIKSVTGFPFKMRATTFKGPPQGPSLAHILQPALAAEALDADGIVVAYLALEPVGPQLALAYSDSDAGRFAAEWHYTVEELQPWVKAEIERIKEVAAAAANPDSVPVPRYLFDLDVPKGARITDPANGLWVAVEGPGSKVITDTGDHWLCAYCDWHDRCIADGA